MLPESVLRQGTDKAPPRRMELQAGPLSMVFEPEKGFLRYIRLGEREVLRGIYAAVRDHNWDTIEPELSNLHQESSADSFRITFGMTCAAGVVDFFWKGSLTGQADGTVAYRLDGVARSAFKRNRIGFCILHPIGPCAGNPCTINKVDGASEPGVFPKHISSDQPFLDLKSISHEVAPGVTAEVSFEGDIFETEDQRNWTDASYKTYCTPLGLPFPVDVAEGTKVSQAVTIRLKGEAPKAPTEAVKSPESVLTGAPETLGPLPGLGLGMASHRRPLAAREITRLKALNLHHLRVDIVAGDPDCHEALGQAAEQARALGTSLEVAVHLSDNAEGELAALLGEVQLLELPVSRWLIFHVNEKSTSRKWAALAREQLAGYDPQAKIGAGTNAYFAELNRDRPPVDVLDFVCYSINPQVHAFDNDSLAETLETQSYTVQSAKAFAGGLPIVVSPVTLKARFNPNATGPEPEPGPDELPSQVDVRQMSLFGAAWTAGSIAYLSQSQAAGVTYYETTGWRGVMETQKGSPLPEKFPSIAGAVFPLYHVLADVGELAGGDVLAVTPGNALAVAGLAIRKGSRLRVLVANLTDHPLTVKVATPMRGTAQVRRLDETNAVSAMTDPEAFRRGAGEALKLEDGSFTLELLPYAVARIDGATKEKAGVS